MIDNSYFYKKRKNIFTKDIIELLGSADKITKKKIFDIKTLTSASKNDISFFHSTKYLNDLNNTKSKLIITLPKFLKIIPKDIEVILVKNVLLSVAKITEYIYPESLNDTFESKNLLDVKKYSFNHVTFGKNTFIGENVKIGKNTSIGHNTIIESYVQIGNNCDIGSNVIIKKSIIENNVKILDGSVIGKKGFGFFPSNKINIRYPHIGLVIIRSNVEVGCNNTIDRGSLSNTIIGENTFTDNQVHIAHNVKIGKNCIIAGQVGIAGSSIIGNNVIIGGQAGISGHLKIGNNVQIGGGSGVIKNIPDNTKVMGYPAKDIRNFIKENK